MRLEETSITTRKQEIINFLDYYGIKSYTILPNGDVNVNGDVNLSGASFEKFPVQFGKVDGNFVCGNNQRLKTLEGAPRWVGGDFLCNHCIRLTSLKGISSKVNKNIFCSNNPDLVSFDGAPQIFGLLVCEFCPSIESLAGLSKSIVKDSINLHALPKLRIILPALKIKRMKSIRIGIPEINVILNKHLKTRDILGCQEELLEAGFEEYARVK